MIIIVVAVIVLAANNIVVIIVAVAVIVIISNNKRRHMISKRFYDFLALDQILRRLQNTTCRGVGLIRSPPNIGDALCERAVERTPEIW